MPSTRGALVFLAGISLWVAARIVGSGDLHIVAVGVAALPILAAIFARWSRHQLVVSRRLSMNRASLGQRVTVDIEVTNRSPAPTSFLLLEDRLPPALGRPARLVLTGLPGRQSQTVTYALVCRTRGRYSLGPLAVDISDPFALTKTRIEYPDRDELVVYPEVEDLRAPVTAPYGAGAGDSTSRHLFRTGDEFYTMREYVQGDDLRRIHWPSVARRGKLMIRQDESARRSSATLYLDTRVSAFGQSGSAPFEKAVSAAASVAVFLARSGFSLRLATGSGVPQAMTEEKLLEALAGVTHTAGRPLAQALLPLRSGALAGSTVVAVTAPPSPADIAALTRMGVPFASRVAIMVYPTDPGTLPGEAASEVRGAASAARLSLARAGWDVFVIGPNGRLSDVWRVNRQKLPASTGSSR